MTARTLGFVRTCALIDALAGVAAAGTAVGAVAMSGLNVGAGRQLGLYAVIAGAGAVALLCGAVLIRRGVDATGRVRSTAHEGLLAAAAGAAVVGGPAAWVTAQATWHWIQSGRFGARLRLPVEAQAWAAAPALLVLLAGANLAALRALRRARRHR